MGIFKWRNKKGQPQTQKGSPQGIDYMQEGQDQVGKNKETLNYYSGMIEGISQVPEMQERAAQAGAKAIMLMINSLFESEYTECKKLIVTLNRINTDEDVQQVITSLQSEEEKEQLRRCLNLRLKGYINDPRTLMLPYVAEKELRGDTLTESEQQLLKESKESRGNREFSTAINVLKLQAIGLITDYKSTFPKLIEGKRYIIEEHLDIHVGYTLNRDKERAEILKSLKEEAETPDFKEGVYIEKAYRRITGRGFYERKDDYFNQLSTKGIQKGIGIEDVTYAQYEIGRDTKARVGDKREEK